MLNLYLVRLSKGYMGPAGMGLCSVDAPAGERNKFYSSKLEIKFEEKLLHTVQLLNKI